MNKYELQLSLYDYYTEGFVFEETFETGSINTVTNYLKKIVELLETGDDLLDWSGHLDD